MIHDCYPSPTCKEGSLTPACSHSGTAVGLLPQPPGSYFFTPVSQHGGSIKCYGINLDLCQWEGENNQVPCPHLLSYWYGSNLLHTLKCFMPVRLVELLCFCILKLWSFFAVIPCSSFWKGVFLPPLPTINEFVT